MSSTKKPDDAVRLLQTGVIVRKLDPDGEHVGSLYEFGTVIGVYATVDWAGYNGIYYKVDWGLNHYEYCDTDEIEMR